MESAFDIAGKNIVNPTAFILALKMMFEWIGDKYNDKKIASQAVKIEKVVDHLFRNNIKTKDIGGQCIYF